MNIWYDSTKPYNLASNARAGAGRRQRAEEEEPSSTLYFYLFIYYSNHQNDSVSREYIKGQKNEYEPTKSPVLFKSDRVDPGSTGFA